MYFPTALLLASLVFLQILRWHLLPQFIDVYYHLLTAWGFLQAGGYSGWDFWQYAPAGRIHLYPPFFHLVLALLLKAGIEEILLAKILQVVLPVLFLILFCRFLEKHYGGRFSFFALLAAASSFSFYLSLQSYLPATLAMIFGLIAIDSLFEKRIIRVVLWLALCFYTHIGVSWFVFLGILLYGFFDPSCRRRAWMGSLFAFGLAIPILLKQLEGLPLVSLSKINEKYFCEFKTLEYLLALLGLGAVFQKRGKHLLFLSLFLSSLIFLTHPYRYFSGQGFLPVALLCAAGLETVFEKLMTRKALSRLSVFFLIGYLLLFSVTFLIEKPNPRDRIRFKTYSLDSSLVNLLFPGRNEHAAATSIWFPMEYRHAIDLIRQNTAQDDIISAPWEVLGVGLASLAGRATANALLPEIGPSKPVDRLEVSAVTVEVKENRALSQFLQFTQERPFEKIGESKMFLLYRNQETSAKMVVRKASLSFRVIGGIAALFVLLLCVEKKLDAVLRRSIKGGLFCSIFLFQRFF